MSVNGFGCEKMIKGLLAEAGYSLSTKMEIKNLLEAAGSYVGRFEKAYQQRTGKCVRWQSKTAEFVLDHIYKIDILVDVCGKSYGVQLTTNPYAVEEKVEVIENRWKAGLYHRGGIASISVVLVKEGQLDSLLSWTDQQRDAVKEQIYDLIDLLIDCEDTGQVGQFTIRLP